MHAGNWELAPCSFTEVSELARALEIDEVTASVLVRRGYADPEAARVFLAGALPGHDPFALGDMREAVEVLDHGDRRRRADLRARRLRRRRHLRDRAGGAAPARARRRRRLASAVALRGGLRPERPDADAARRGGVRPRAHGRLRDHGRRRGGAGAARSVSRSSSPTITGRPTRFPPARSSRR